MSAKIAMMLGFIPQFKNFSKCEVDGQPSNEQEFLASVRLYKPASNPAEPSVLVAPSEWGFTYADVMAQEVAVKDYAMSELRKKRDELLAATDGVTMKCMSRGMAVPDEWRAYQDALRDLPANSDPDFDAGGNLVGINWPTEPATKP